MADYGRTVSRKRFSWPLFFESETVNAWTAPSVFKAMALDGVVHIDSMRCVGCGVCALACPEGALVLARRDEAEGPPLDTGEWRRQRAAARGLDLDAVL